MSSNQKRLSDKIRVTVNPDIVVMVAELVSSIAQFKFSSFILSSFNIKDSMIISWRMGLHNIYVQKIR